jgi:4-amino-4-deoxy-L-arabinose transferase-like glycosyltransferase
MLNSIIFSKYKIAITLFFILILASFLRIYKIDQIPPSISWDEAAVGYNAYTIANWGKDEWGKSFPLYFKSFEENKNPVDVYLTAISVKFLGLSEFSIRLSSALFGIFNVLLIFFLAKILFKSNLLGLIAALFLSISPYNIQFSRFNHEANFVLFFFMLALVLFFLGKERKNILLSFSFLSFGISILAYQSPKIVIPPVLILLIILYFRDLWNIKKYFLLGCLFISVISMVILLNPALTGIVRYQQTAIPEEIIKNTTLFKNTNNELLGRLEVARDRYLIHLSPQYLFLTGDKNPMFSTKTVGEFYKIDALFLIIGFISLILKRSKPAVILLFWALLSPLPPCLAGGEGEVPHAARALFMMGSWTLISAFGFYSIINLFKKPILKMLVALFFFIILGFMFKNYLNDYYQNYAKESAINWQYGMKQAAEFVKDHNGYFQVYTTDIRFQPYIFFLFYLETPLSEFRDTVVYNDDSEKRKYNLVTFFNNYHFGDWDPIESMPNPGVLYIVSSSQYDGLRHKNLFDVKKIIRYPDGSDAFFLVSYP